MTYAETLQSRYADIRKRLYAVPERVQAYRPPIMDVPEPNPESTEEWQPNPRMPEWRQVAETVAYEFGFTFDELVGRSRSFKYNPARRECWYRLKVMGLGWMAIGRRMSRDHSTIVHGVQAYCAEKGVEMP